MNDAGWPGCRHGLPAPEHIIVARPRTTAPHDGMTTTDPLAASTANWVFVRTGFNLVPVGAPLPWIHLRPCSWPGPGL